VENRNQERKITKKLNNKEGRQFSDSRKHWLKKRKNFKNIKY